MSFDPAQQAQGPGQDFTMVATVPDVEELSRILASEDRIGVDMEADSLYHYQEKVCLLQIAAAGRVFVVDPLALPDLAPLAPVFEDRSVLKVFHGADYDIRSLYRDFRIQVRPLFDTQVAARFLGMAETGLATLLEQRFGLRLEKKYQKKNWAERPLSQEMLAYGAMDAAHLLPLAGQMEKELEEANRLDWVAEECEALSNVRPTRNGEGPLFLRFKGAGKLDPRGLAVLESLLRFRDAEAQRLDRPPFKVMACSHIMDLAMARPETFHDLEKTGILSARMVKLHGRHLVDAVKKGLAVPEHELIPYPPAPRTRMGRYTAQRIEALKAWRLEHAKKLCLDPALVLTNVQIRALSLKKPQKPKDFESIAELKQWQRQTFASDIAAVLSKVP